MGSLLRMVMPVALPLGVFAIAAVIFAIWRRDGRLRGQREMLRAGGGAPAAGQHHEISLMCDDIEQTVAELRAKGAEFAGGIAAAGFGLTTMLRVPGAGGMMLYQPRHPLAHSL